MELRSYQRISDDEDDGNLEGPSVPLSSSPNPQPKSEDRTATTDEITLTVLKGEQSKKIKIFQQASISQLKSVIEAAYSVPVAMQRLVCKGKPLRPDGEPLSVFQVTDGSVLHLFPLPSNALTSTETPHNSQVVSLYAWGNPRSEHIHGIPPHLLRPVHFVPEVVQSIREVKMWCYILIITSSMDIFTNLSFLGSQGHPGRSVLDAIVNVLQTIFSFAGLYVGQMGLRCTTTAEAEAIKHYVCSLSTLAVLNILLKAVWVVDVILLAQKGIREAEEDEGDDGLDDGKNVPGKGGGQYVDDPDGEDGPEHMSSRSFMIYFSIQAVIMAGIAISMWVACVNRARSFQRAVQSYEGIATRA